MQCVYSIDKEGYIYTNLGPLEVDSIEMAQSYRFDRKMQEIYLSRDLFEFIPRCQLPDIQLPVPQAVPLPQPPEPSINEEVLKGLQSTHDASVNMLWTQGIDACQVYKEKGASTILAHIRPRKSNVHSVAESARPPKS